MTKTLKRMLPLFLGDANSTRSARPKNHGRASPPARARAPPVSVHVTGGAARAPHAAPPHNGAAAALPSRELLTELHKGGPFFGAAPPLASPAPPISALPPRLVSPAGQRHPLDEDRGHAGASYAPALEREDPWGPNSNPNLEREDPWGSAPPAEGDDAQGWPPPRSGRSWGGGAGPSAPRYDADPYAHPAQAEEVRAALEQTFGAGVHVWVETPSGLPPGAPQAFFYHAATRETRWERPEGRDVVVTTEEELREHFEGRGGG